MGEWIRAFGRDENAATAIEYGLIAAGIAVAIIAVVFGLGTGLNDVFGSGPIECLRSKVEDERRVAAVERSERLLLSDGELLDKLLVSAVFTERCQRNWSRCHARPRCLSTSDNRP